MYVQVNIGKNQPQTKYIVTTYFTSWIYYEKVKNIANFDLVVTNAVELCRKTKLDKRKKKGRERVEITQLLRFVIGIHLP